MSLIKRRILATIFILLFFVLTPPLLLYTAGYRWNPNKHRIERTGLLVLKSQPKRANIYIDDELQNDTTDTLIDTLLPNTYSVRIEKEGYHSWSQDITVQPTLSTFLDDIILFKNNPPELLSDNIIHASYSDDSNIIFFTGADSDTYNLYTAGIDDNKKSIQTNIARNHTLSSHGASIRLIESKALSTAITDYNAFNGELIGKTELINQIPTDAFIMNEEYVLYVIGNTVFNAHIHEGNSAPSVLFTFERQPLASVLINETLVYAIPSADNRVIIASRNITSPAEKKVLTALRTSNSIELAPLHNRNDVLLYTDTSQNILYALNTENGDIIDIFKDAKHMSQNDTGQLLYHTDFEIWLVDDIGAEEKKLITRLSNPITNAYWHASGRYILYSTHSSIVSQHITNASNKNTTTLVQNADIKKSIHNASDSIIFYIDNTELKRKAY